MPAGIAEAEVSPRALLESRAVLPARTHMCGSRGWGGTSLGASRGSKQMCWAPPCGLKLMLIFCLQVNVLYLHVWGGYLFSVYLA